jgi:hypothetical protein
MFHNIDKNDKVWTLLSMQYGQVMAHDMGLIDGTTQSSTYRVLRCIRSIRIAHPDGRQSTDNVILDLMITESHRTRCCTFDGQIIPEAMMMPQCFPMLVPHDDPVYSKFLVRCLNFVRSLTDIDRGCSFPNKPAQQVCSCISFTDSLVVTSCHET